MEKWEISGLVTLEQVVSDEMEEATVGLGYCTERFHQDPHQP